MACRWLVVSACVSVVVACSVVNAPDDPQADEDDGAGGAGSTTNSSSTGGTTSCQGPADCAHLDELCSDPVCENGTCVAEPAPAGTACGDPPAGDCDAQGSCDDAGTCLAQSQPDGTACEGDPCIDGETCMAGQCTGGAPKDCSGLTKECDKGVCEPTTGSCTTMTETACMNGDACCPAGCDVSTDGDCGPPSGTVRHVNGLLLNVQYVPCGSGAPGACTANLAKSSCAAIGRRVVSHASNGNNQVLSLGATNSCLWSISYFTVSTAMPAGACLVGVSNLDWTDCCGTTQWHGNTVMFGTPNATFGYVEPTNSGFVSNNPNVSGQTWGCIATGSAASNLAGCTTQYVACAP